MNAAKPTASSGKKRRGIWAIVAWPVSGQFSTAISVLVLIAVFAAGFAYVWRRWGVVVRNNPRYVLDEDRLEITRQPDWVRCDVKHEVMRDGRLGELHLLDPQVTIRVARAFSLHTWVADVRRVRKEHPGRVVVELDYRRPVGMVEVTTQGQRGLLPVDAHGVLLPPQDFSAEQTQDYVRIVVGDTLPVGPVGTSWGDDRVAGAARIAGQLGGDWKTLDIVRLTCRPNETGGRRKPDELLYELFTRSGTRILWGHSQGYERATEAAGPDKLLRLVRFFQQRGQRTGETFDIDVQSKAGLTVAPLAAARPVSN